MRRRRCATANGVFIRGVYHESPVFTYTEGRVCPGLLDGLPEEFQSQVSEPAFSHPDGTPYATFVLWRCVGDERWYTAEGLDFSPADDDEVHPDGSWLLDIVFDDIAEKCLEYAGEVCEVGLAKPAVAHVIAFLPLTDDVIRALNPEAEPAYVQAGAEKFGLSVGRNCRTARSSAVILVGVVNALICSGCADRPLLPLPTRHAQGRSDSRAGRYHFGGA
jgi:hypothetical protein